LAPFNLYSKERGVLTFTGSVGFMEYIAGTLAVSTMTAANLVIIWLLDRFEKEPIWLLAFAFLWGAVPAIVISLVAELIFGVPLNMLLGRAAADVVSASFVAPVVEESAKAFALLALFVILRNELDDILDGIVFGAIIGAGFAWIEDIFYICGAFSEGGLENMGSVFFLRCFVFGLNHAFFTALTGLGFGAARVVRSCWFGCLAIFAFFGLAVGAHFFHNFLVSVAGEAGVVVSFLAHWLGVFGLFVVIVIAWLFEWNWIRQELRDEVQLGHIGERDYRQVSKWFGRLGWELRFLFALDFLGFLRIRKMFNLLVKLAFLKRSQRRAPNAGTAKKIDELRGRVARLRAKFA